MSKIIKNLEIGGLSIRQDFETGMFNANDLWNDYKKENENKKRVQHYFDNKAYIKRVNDIVQIEKIETPLVERTTGKFGGTFFHPYLFLDFALWLSIDYKPTVARWMFEWVITDKLKQFGVFFDLYNEIFNSNPSALPYEYNAESDMINRIVSPPDGKVPVDISIFDTIKKINIEMIKAGENFYQRKKKLSEVAKYLIK